jgi:4-aminobutyrate aminotransferase
MGSEDQSAALVRRDAAVFFHQHASSPCLSALRAVEGAWLEDADGRRYLDFHGNSVHHIGYAHPRLIAAIRDQLERLPFSPRRYTNDAAIALAEKLVSVWPGSGTGRVLFATGGSDAIEIALKLARTATGRHETISFAGSYHGDGLGALGLAGDRGSVGRLGPLLPGQYHAPAYWQGTDGPTHSLDAIRGLLDRHDIGAVVAEPIRSTPHIPPSGFWPEVRALCDRHGALLIFDEIPTGLGKVGRWFASELVGVVPDISVLGKALGGGVLPIAAVIGRTDLNVAPELNLGHYTHEKNPVTARAALTTLQIIADEGLVARSAALGASALARLQGIVARNPLLDHARGIGMLMAVKFRDDAVGGRSARELAEAASRLCFARGLSLTVKEGSSLGLSPPLTIVEADFDWALAIVEEVVASLAA